MRVQEIRFRITHFIAWCFFTFVIFALTRATQPNGSHLVQFAGVQRMFSAMTGILYGGISTGALLLACQFFRSRLVAKSFFLGHWIVLCLFLPLSVEVLALTIGATISTFKIETLGDIDPLLTLLNSFARLGQIAICLLALFINRQGGLWRIFFSVLIFYFAGVWLYQYFEYPDVSSSYFVVLIPDLLSLPSVGVLTAISFIILRSKQTRDWVHWLGVIAYLFLNLWGLFWNTIGWRFMF